MIYAFGNRELDTDRIELRAEGVMTPIEPQVFALIRLLVENRHRMVSKDEIIACVWNGRIVSDAAIASRVKSARRALGDSGQTQDFIRTVHGQGFVFVADVATKGVSPAVGMPPLDARVQTPTERPSIAVLRFRTLGQAIPGFPVAEALPHDLITELSRLHWLFVIARSSSFRLNSPDATLADVKNHLNVQYCLTGEIELIGRSMSISVELSDTRDEGVVWSERFCADIGAVHEIRERVVHAVTSAVEIRVPRNEAQRAYLRSPENLDAWSAYHLGLHHMYRFNPADTEIATAMFKRAIAMEPDFARAYAGLSFTHFQVAFLRYANASEAADLAQHYASQCLERDPLDPFGHFTMGRTHWLSGNLDASLPWLERANALNPNYAQARYARGWAEALLGNALESHSNIDAALTLSPLDPLAYGMLGAKALSYVAQEQPAAAAEWAERAARSPGAHALIEMIAAMAHELNGDAERARKWSGSARARAGHLNRIDFLRAFPFSDSPTRERVAQTLENLGF